MGILGGISGMEAVKRFSKIGYVVIRQRGSHVRMRYLIEQNRKPLTIPLHAELKTGLLRSLIRDAGITVDEFLDLK